MLVLGSVKTSPVRLPNSMAQPKQALEQLLKDSHPVSKQDFLYLFVMKAALNQFPGQIPGM